MPERPARRDRPGRAAARGRRRDDRERRSATYALPFAVAVNFIVDGVEVARADGDRGALGRRRRVERGAHGAARRVHDRRRPRR